MVSRAVTFKAMQDLKGEVTANSWPAGVDNSTNELFSLATS
jgi:hypothetical protein